ncbi:NPCBM/NEW2 domain-containing protein [Streptomyces sp. NRRL F-5135]|uniref:NPCBM/NEW2 domain-containing protein n=1 Tax=Streptomyces sp. NRRL F-5135 TaxID=1463858 RepID=UPI0004C7C75B|nr:NPCBM/NEW2 domain-containing protein [Streptomyces sp. NRRL F-5135]
MPDPAPPPPGRKLGDVAALISSLAAVAGVLLGFFGLPAVVDSPTAQTATPATTATATATATVTVTAPAPPASGSDNDGTAKPPAPAPLPSGSVPLTDLSPVRGADSFTLRSVTMGSKSYESAMVLALPCSGAPIDYSVNERYTSLTFTVGLDDNGVAELIKVTIQGDGMDRKTVGAEINRPHAVTVDVTGVVRLRITSTGECGESDRLVVALADATLHS